MRKGYIIVILVIVIIIIFFLILNYLGVFFGLNPAFNKLFSGELDRSCSLNSNCEIKPAGCGFCVCSEAVNKDWDRFCPFKKPIYMEVYCAECLSYNSVECVDGVCTASWKQ